MNEERDLNKKEYVFESDIINPVTSSPYLSKRTKVTVTVRAKSTKNARKILDDIVKDKEKSDFYLITIKERFKRC